MKTFKEQVRRDMVAAASQQESYSSHLGVYVSMGLNVQENRTIALYQAN